MWQHALSDEIFKLGLHYYLATREFQGAETDHLIQAFEKAAEEVGPYPRDINIEDFITNWSTEIGYPVVHVERRGKHLYLTQERFSYKGNFTECCQRWLIPLTFTPSFYANFTDTAPKFWMKERSRLILDVELELKETDWVIFNIQQTGFYRVDYDDGLWHLIIQQLQTNASMIHPINRAQLVDDAFNLARAGHVGYPLLFNLVQYLPKENDFLPWSSADSGFEYLSRVLVDSEAYPYFITFVNQIVSNLYLTVGVEDLPGEILPDKIVRNIAINWFCLTGNEDCLSQTKAAMNRILAYPNTDHSPDLRQTIFCNGLRLAEERDYNDVVKHLKATVDQGIRTNLINSLGCMSNQELQDKYLQSSIAENDKNIYRAQERNRILQAVYTFGGKPGLLSTINFITTSHNEIDKFYSTSASSTSPAKTATRRIAERVTKVSQEPYENLLNVLMAAKKLSTEEHKQLLEVVKANIDWLDLYNDQIKEYFSNYFSGGAPLPTAAIGLTVTLFVINLIIF